MQGTAKSHEELLGSPTNARILEFEKGVKTEIVVKKKQTKNTTLQLPPAPQGPRLQPLPPQPSVCPGAAGARRPSCSVSPASLGMCHDLKAVVLPMFPLSYLPLYLTPVNN